MRIRVIICALTALSSFTSAANADAVIADGARLMGHWTCNMEHSSEGLVLKMTGHTHFGRDGGYEATGLGVVHFGDPNDQIRWVATSSGQYAQDGSTLRYTDLRILPTALPPVGMEDRSLEEVDHLYGLVLGGIDVEPEGPQVSEILSLDSRQLVIRSEDHIWNCQRRIGGS